MLYFNAEQYPNVHMFRIEQVISNENSGVKSRGK